MKKLLLVLVVFSITGCSTVGNYKETSDPSVFDITVRMNAFSVGDKQKRVTEITDLATEACGSSKFSMEGVMTSKVDKITTYNNGQPLTTNVYVFMQKIRCIR
ncbi:hypothetical protein NBRC116188_17650 [Oceaniserpentilla sp. 4NH20-0058]|uniref:hypothetical protein n=1 Tax=Oceaniserpentilla sp. 4NH20-0058 TaxID=3127660 RepID=UPI003102750C